jgi:hypothetical protein
MNAEHIERRHHIVVQGPVERVFPLFTPLGERSWVAGWNPEFLHPADGETCEGMIFRTGAGDELTLWACVDWRPEVHRVRYARVTPASRFGLVEVGCSGLADGRTEAVVTYAFTALSEQGRAHLAEVTETAFAAMIDGWREAIDHRLSETAVAAAP